MRKYNKELIIIFLFALLVACHPQPIEKLHPSEYSWTIDTLNLTVDDGRWRPTDILYISDNNIYLFGENSFYNPIVWHYNGSIWQDKIITGQANNILAAKKIDGTIYGVGDTRWYLPEGIDRQGGVSTFNGDAFEQIFYAHADSMRITAFNDIWGNSNNNIWVGGYYGILHYYDGIEWKNYSLADTIHIHHFSGTDSSLYAVGYYSGNGTLNGYLLKNYISEWIMDDQFHMSYADYLFRPFGHLDVFVIDNTIYTCGDGVFRKEIDDSSWQKLWQFSSYKFWDVSGSAPDNIYFVGECGNAVFWDGETPCDLDSIYYPEITYKKAWADGDRVIIVGYCDNTTYVMWGNKKE